MLRQRGIFLKERRKGEEVKGRKGILLLAVALAAFEGVAFQEIPKASAKALGVTRGKPFRSGMVFVNGKYVAPPYVIERWGTGIRINAIPVTGQIIEWDEFLKTQSGVKVTKTEEKVVETPPPPPPPPVAAEATAPAQEITAASLDALFDDVPPPKKAASSAPAVRTPVFSTPQQPKVTVSYAIEGEFVSNDASKALVKRINAARTEIDRLLRADGFICFGDAYSRVVGDARTAKRLMAKLPELQQHSNTIDEFRAGVRSANLVYLNEILCDQLFENRVDYRKLKERRVKMQQASSYDDILKDVSKPLF